MPDLRYLACSVIYWTSTKILQTMVLMWESRQFLTKDVSLVIPRVDDHVNCLTMKEKYLWADMYMKYSLRRLSDKNINCRCVIKRCKEYWRIVGAKYNRRSSVNDSYCQVWKFLFFFQVPYSFAKNAEFFRPLRTIDPAVSGRGILRHTLGPKKRGGG